MQFLKMARARMKVLNMPEDMLKRNVNVGFSGGEKKRNEMLQLAMLTPRFAVLDETDSGLDIDALKMVADTVNSLRGPSFSALVITHYQRLLNHIVPDRVHVLQAGRIVRSGGPELAQELEASGYAAVQSAA
jgi:Fe-S cluster assembly ATP-binding protein